MADLLTLLDGATTLRKVALTDGGEYAGPCPWCGGRDRFRAWPDSDRPHYWCRGCDRQGDALQFVMDFQGVGFVEAKRLLGLPDTPPAMLHRQEPRRAPLPDDSPPCAAWQAQARTVVAEAQAALWADSGRSALAYLRTQRGLRDATIHAAGLGYLPLDRREPPALWGLDGDKPVWLPRGIVIPCEAQGQLWYLKVRRPTGEPKYLQPRGSRPALYGADTLAGQAVVVLTEGEFDCLLLRQCAGDLLGVATLGSAQAPPRGRWLTALLPAQRLLVTYDADAAGARGASALAALSARVRVVQPVHGKDLTEMHQAGGDLRSWAQFLLARHAPATRCSRAVADPWADLRAALAAGRLDGLGPLHLSDGSSILDVAAYTRQRLADLHDPRLRDEAAKRLRRLITHLETLEPPA